MTVETKVELITAVSARRQELFTHWATAAKLGLTTSMDYWCKRLDELQAANLELRAIKAEFPVEEIIG